MAATSAATANTRGVDVESGASDATVIPVNTLRKWCRREDVTSHLESDGNLTLRIVDPVIRAVACAGPGTQHGRTEPSPVPEPEVPLWIEVRRRRSPVRPSARAESLLNFENLSS